MGDNEPASSALTWSAKEELIRSYTEKEVDLTQRLEKEERKVDDLRKRMRALKNYARALKYSLQNKNRNKWCIFSRIWCKR